MFQLNCSAQQYDWGKPGATSEVARLLAVGRAATPGAPAADIDPAAPYAEYWFGTHPRAPSKLASDAAGVAAGTSLTDFLQRTPSALGIAPYSPVTPLPFLLKVLSIARALSIQVHPAAPLAQRLHNHADAAVRVHYADGNHKPELALALTPFQALCGFRPADELLNNIDNTLELKQLLSEGAIEKLRSASTTMQVNAAIEAVFSAIVTTDASTITSQVHALVARLGASPTGRAVDTLAVELNAIYPGDVGVLCVYLLNVLHLTPGQALYLGAGVPHAYLSGDAVEIMASSDNVIRVGFTSKFKDVHTTLAALKYEAGVPQLVEPRVLDDVTRLFVPPHDAHVSEFMLLHSVLARERGGYALDLPAGSGAAIMLIQRGHGTAACAGGQVHTLAEGTVWLIPAGVKVSLTATGEEALVAFTAVNNVYATPAPSA